MRYKISVGHTELNGNGLARESGNSGTSCARKSENGAENFGGKTSLKKTMLLFLEML